MDSAAIRGKTNVACIWRELLAILHCSATSREWLTVYEKKGESELWANYIKNCAWCAMSYTARHDVSWIGEADMEWFVGAADQWSSLDPDIVSNIINCSWDTAQYNWQYIWWYSSWLLCEVGDSFLARCGISVVSASLTFLCYVVFFFSSFDVFILL